MQYWDYNKNKNVTPDELGVSSKELFWWFCKNGHSHETSVINKVSSFKKGKNQCLICQGKIVIKENSLEALNPSLANEWNYSKNENLKPSDVTPNSHKKVWWVCQRGHEW